MGIDGILNINKATGMTSHDVVAKVRKLLGQKRVGHAGTLDPAAGGVLPICVGQGTRVAEYLSESGKAYQAEIVFGVVTDTYDVEGAILRTADVANLTLAQIEQALPHFLGSQKQMPPRYSAIKIQGQPAYKRMRAGEEVVLEPRLIEITRLEIMAWKPPRLTLSVECSKGTYIRSLAYDLGEYLGCGAHLGGLIRTRSGPFSLTESITLEQLAEAVSTGSIASYLHPTDEAIQQFPAILLDEAAVERVLHGNAFRDNSNTPVAQYPGPGLARVYNAQGHFLALAEWDTDRQVWQPKKVFDFST
jgi:tRNA pseudouridine55 synthase